MSRSSVPKSAVRASTLLRTLATPGGSGVAGGSRSGFVTLAASVHVSANAPTQQLATHSSVLPQAPPRSAVAAELHRVQLEQTHNKQWPSATSAVQQLSIDPRHRGTSASLATAPSTRQRVATAGAEETHKPSSSTNKHTAATQRYQLVQDAATRAFRANSNSEGDPPVSAVTQQSPPVAQILPASLAQRTTKAVHNENTEGSEPQCQVIPAVDARSTQQPHTQKLHRGSRTPKLPEKMFHSKQSGAAANATGGSKTQSGKSFT